MLKPIEPASSATTVWHKDPAFKQGDAKAFLDAVDKGNPTAWREHLELIDGKQPTLFTIGVIPPSDMVRIEDDARLGTDKARMHSLFWNCFVYGLRDVKGGFDAKKITVNGVDYVDPDWIEKTFGGQLRMCAVSIGKAIWYWNTVQDVDVKNS